MFALLSASADTVSIVKDLINNLGVPVAMICYFIWDKVNSTSKMVTAINNNNAILGKLLTKLGQDDLADAVKSE